MVNNARKGRELQRKAAKILESWGYVVHVTKHVSRPGRSASNDIFGVFDIVALHKENGAVLFVQVTTVAHMAARRNKIDAWRDANGVSRFAVASDCVEVVVWGWVGGRGKQEFKQDVLFANGCWERAATRIVEDVA